MNQSLILYTNRQHSSPYVLSVYATLYEKGLPFELKTVDLATGENLAQPYSRLSLTSRVPTLTIGDFSLSESSAIIEYLEEAFPPPDFASVFPNDLRLRARARQIQAWVRSDMGILREERSTVVIYGARNPKPLSEPARQAADKLLRAADALIDEQGSNLFGAWSIADVDFSVMLNRLCANGDPVPPKIRKYVERQAGRPCVEKWWSLARS
ncbi:MAG: glutathione transferase [Pollutimonas bauzanensis]|uniref:Glutathione S-transferase n=1 Tax=Pollutimonas bauzanensis TaxID=658167 RepID=A0A1M5VD51_9BURK|nr:glutathione transferase [Pollutimonas bauzanensis]SHH73170.1 Glutathione S-transferase [Pollutimonas bauzanensis]